jgi:hypothetical protein
MNRYLIILVMISVLLASCAGTKVSTAVSTEKISPKAKIYVLHAFDGSYGGRVYDGSGLLVSRKVLNAVRKVYLFAQLHDETDELKAIKEAKNNSIDYIIIPELEHWEDRLTVLSGYRDKVNINLRVIKVSAQSVIISKNFYVTNNSMTFLETKPEDLLDSRFSSFVMSLFDVNKKGSLYH